MPLRECGSTGRARVIEGEPPVDARRGALYVPASEAGSETGWGLYDYANRLLPSGAGGGDMIAPDEAVAAAVEGGAGEILVYAGLLTRDPRGFLLGSFTRLWGNAWRAGGARLLFHAREGLDELLDSPAVASVLGALGIEPEDCVAFDTPTRLERVVIPAPSFETGRLAFPAVARLASTVAIRLSGRTEPAYLGPKPVHVSSAYEPEPAFADEEAFDRALQDAGVVVLHPSEMSLAALVTRVRSAPLLSSTAPAGQAGGGCLAALFREGGPRLLLCGDEAPAMDSLLIDAVRGHETLAVAPVTEGADAQAYLRVMRRLLGVHGMGGALPGVEERVDLARTGRCTSIEAGVEASVLVGRPLTGATHLRIGGAPFPWWQIEWDAAREIEEVVIYGPLSGDERPTELTLLGSFDGKDWMRLGEKNDPAPVGGIDGNAHRFRAGAEPWRARLLRLQSGTGVLALDGIEILAPAAAAETLLGARAG